MASDKQKRKLTQEAPEARGAAPGRRPPAQGVRRGGPPGHRRQEGAAGVLGSATSNRTYKSNWAYSVLLASLLPAEVRRERLRRSARSPVANFVSSFQSASGPARTPSSS